MALFIRFKLCRTRCRVRAKSSSVCLRSARTTGEDLSRAQRAQKHLDKVRDVLGVELVRRRSCRYCGRDARSRRAGNSCGPAMRSIGKADSLYCGICRSVCNFQCWVHQQMVMMFWNPPWLTIEGPRRSADSRLPMTAYSYGACVRAMLELRHSGAQKAASGGWRCPGAWLFSTADHGAEGRRISIARRNGRTSRPRPRYKTRAV